MPPRVSVIIPAFNAANYLRSAIDSVLAQTATCQEIIVVNDGSTDGGATRSIVASYGDRLRYCEQENKGVGGALNTGLSMMQGEFFAWLSHDDVFLPEKIARQLAAYDRLGREDVVLYSNYGLIDNEGRFISPVSMDQIVGPHPALGLLRGCINGCTVLVPRAAFDKAGAFKEELRYTQDYDLWSRMRKHYDFVLQPEMLVLTRQHPEQFSKHTQASAEGDDLWIKIIDAHSTVERAMIAGSSHRFLADTAKFLKLTPYQSAAAYAAGQSRTIVDSTLVSVVIPFFNEMALTARALKSVLAQTHSALDIVLVNDGSTESDEIIRDIAGADKRVSLIHQDNRGPGQARNRGMQAAKGEYVAFLDADDVFLPEKIETQLRMMQREGALMSHTSYSAAYADGSTQVIHSGGHSGLLYPEIVSSCPIATPCVMLHRALIAAGLRFPDSVRIGEDTILWIQIAREHPVLGIDQPLTTVHVSDRTTSVSVPASLAGLRNIRSSIEDCGAEIRGQLSELDKNIAMYEVLAARGEHTHAIHSDTHDIHTGAKGRLMRYYVVQALNRFPRSKMLLKKLLRRGSVGTLKADSNQAGRTMVLNRAELAKEVERLQDELAATKLERDALQSRYLRAISQEGSASLTPNPTIK